MARVWSQPFSPVPVLHGPSHTVQSYPDLQPQALLALFWLNLLGYNHSDGSMLPSHLSVPSARLPVPEDCGFPDHRRRHCLFPARHAVCAISLGHLSISDP